MFFLSFILLMEEEKSSMEENPLHKKILNRELTSEQFETLFKNFRSSLETESIRFYQTYQWFEGDDSVVFAGDPKQEKKRATFYSPINPKFVVSANKLVVKLGFAQADICGIDGTYFYTGQSCWPVLRWEFPIEEIREYASSFKKAIVVALESFEIPE